MVMELDGKTFANKQGLTRFVTFRFRKRIAISEENLVRLCDVIGAFISHT